MQIYLACRSEQIAAWRTALNNHLACRKPFISTYVSYVIICLLPYVGGVLLHIFCIIFFGLLVTHAMPVMQVVKRDKSWGQLTEIQPRLGLNYWFYLSTCKWAILMLKFGYCAYICFPKYQSGWNNEKNPKDWWYVTKNFIRLRRLKRALLWISWNSTVLSILSPALNIFKLIKIK